MFELIDLHTRDFNPDDDVDPAVGDPTYVTTARVPAMSPLPEILVWGARSFLRTGHRNPTDREVFVEGFAVAVVHTVPKNTVL